MSPPEKTRRGRRPGSVDTRLVVLDAARARFAADGFAATTFRRIAADAGVDAALVVRFFGSKQELFAASMALPAAALDQVASAFDGPVDELGTRVAGAWLGLWEDGSEYAEPLLAMYRSAVGNDEAAAQLRGFVEERLLRVIGPRLGTDPGAASRAAAASSMMLGVIVGRRVIRIPMLADPSLDDLVDLVAPAIQAMLAPASP